MAAATDLEQIREQVEKILASGVLGRSRFYAALLEYLLACGERGHSPKEIEIAAEVFNRGGDFDPSQDSMVRVYAHNLRQKLVQFYAEQGSDEPDQITVPKGEYRITLASPPPEPAPAVAVPVRQPSGRAFGLALIVAVSLLGGVLLDRVLGGDGDTPSAAYAEVARSPLWAPLTDDDMPVTVVIGDYYILGETDRFGNVGRMVREFEINSSRDLEEWFLLHPEDADRYIDLDQTYLPSGTAFALRDLMSVLTAGGKEIRVVTMSHFDTSVLRDSHVVYVGFLSRLDMLGDFVFAGSQLVVGDTYDELINIETGDTYVSEAGLPNGSGSYRDYGLFSTLPGPGGNQLVFVAGTRDEGLMQTAAAVSNRLLVQSSIDAVAGGSGQVPPAYELLYEVAGLDRTNLDARIVHAGPLADGRISIGRLAP